MLERSGAARADAQCPQPREDKTEAVNAQFEAEEFNRKLGATLHAVVAGGFPARGGEAGPLLGNPRDRRLLIAGPLQSIRRRTD